MYNEENMFDSYNSKQTIQKILLTWMFPVMLLSQKTLILVWVCVLLQIYVIFCKNMGR